MPGANVSFLRAVVFDLDDTLYPERQYVRSGYRAVAEHLRGRADRRSNGRPGGDLQDPEGWLWNRFLCGRTAGAFDEMNERFHLGLSAAGVRELVEVYRTHRPDVQPYPGTAELLGRLHEGYRLGLLTDGFLPAQQLKLEVLALERFFDGAVFTEALGRQAWKPSVEGFEAIRERLDVPHDRCAYVADNPAKDFVAPNGLGWRTVQFLQPGQFHAGNPPCEGGRPGHVVHDGGELWAALIAGE